MRNLKFMLPMLAFIMAIGMSFAFVNTTADEDYYVTKYIQVPGGWATIDVECDPQSDECTVTFSDDLSGMEYRVYNSKSLSDPAEGDGQAIELEGSVPNPD